MSWSIYNINFHISICDGSVLCQYRNSSLTFEGMGIHYEVAKWLVVSEYFTLFQQGVNESSFAMVYMRNDSDVTDFLVVDWFGGWIVQVISMLGQGTF